MIAADSLVSDAGENANLIQRIFFLLVRKFGHFNLFESVGLVVSYSAHMVHGGVGALT